MNTTARTVTPMTEPPAARPLVTIRTVSKTPAPIATSHIVRAVRMVIGTCSAIRILQAFRPGRPPSILLAPECVLVPGLPVRYVLSVIRVRVSAPQ
nr:hypothetical protein Ade03nite_63560 [Actinoplanes derwentensis]